MKAKMSSTNLNLNKMKNYKFVVERTQTGFSAFAEDEDLPVFTTGKDFEELKKNILEALNLYLEHAHTKAAAAEDIISTLVFMCFFVYY